MYGISLNRVLPEYSTYPLSSSFKVLSSRYVLINNKTIETNTGIMLHREPNNKGNPIVWMIDPR
jgi:hypothetical protein